MSKVIVFCGPTLAGIDLPVGVQRLPPAGLGDMLRAAPAARSTMVLIDGLFGRQRSPWHKEILELLSDGHRIVGAASMGALRACELHQYGMIGIGLIYRAYRRGIFEDDGDVAVVHAPGELGWRPLSLALADVLMTLRRALRAGIIDPEIAKNVAKRASEMSFKDRCWSALLENLPTTTELRRALEALPSAKQADALLAIRFALNDTRWPPLAPQAPATHWQRFLP